MKRIYIDLPDDYEVLLDKISEQEGVATKNLLLRAVRDFLSKKVSSLPRLREKEMLLQATHTQDLLASMDLVDENDSLEEIVQWRRSFPTKQ